MNDDCLHKDVFAHFGRAYYYAEVVHRGLVNLAAFVGADEFSTQGRFDERLAEHSRMTMGELVPLAKDLFPVAVHASLDWALTTRNHLAHGFWYERVHGFLSDAGMESMIEDLELMAEQFGSLNEILDRAVLEHARKQGVPEERITEAMANPPPAEPIVGRRTPRPGEYIEVVRAWESPGGGFVLEDDIGELWQACEVGLAWLMYDQVPSEWPRLERIDRYLPSGIVARPKGVKPWNYKLHVRSGALIVVRREPGAEAFGWRIEPVPEPDRS